MRRFGKQAIVLTSSATALALGAFSASEAAAEDLGTAMVEEIVVTATGRAEARTRIPGTVQVLEEAQIERSTARSVTDLLAENAVAFLSEWTPGQTSINIRGGASDGQGRDFRSQVLVLVNGRRAGTANLSKLSPSELARVEVVRGPSSVVYGSQNIGGVINLITKDGRSDPGLAIDLTAGSWELFQGEARLGGVSGDLDYYVGFSSGQRDDYHAGEGGGRQINSDWERLGVAGALGWSIAADHRLELSARTDGTYDAGFRGSGANYFSKEDRTSASGDLIYTGRFGDLLDFTAQGYLVRDVDELKWASPVIRGSNGQPTPGTSRDYNRRRLEIAGTRLQPRLTPFEGNMLLLGWDYEHSKLRSVRERVGVEGRPISQVPPFDNNQTENVHALYFEDAQSLFDDRVTLRGGLRWTKGETSFDPTPNLANQRTRTEEYEATTYSIGATFRATDRLTLRLGAASGFRAPNATELAADFTALGGGRTFGNPDLEPETSRQIEAGLAYSADALRADLALFRNVIKDRIVARPRAGVVNTNDFVNNTGDVEVAGIETQLHADLLPLLERGAGDWFWAANVVGNYNFELDDNGVSAAANTRILERAYRYQLALSSQVGRQAGERGWSLQVVGTLNGPVRYNTEEALLIPLAEPNSNFIHRKPAYWLWRVRGEVRFGASVAAFAAINNLFDKNYHPLFIALDREPVLGDLRFFNGGRGTSAPGREVLAGLKFRFGSGG
jgi:vitamin B12 transporter